MNNEIVLDIESNGFIFESTCIWTISARNTFTDERLTINPFKDGQAKNKLMDFVFQEDNPTIIFHNGLGFDIFVIMNILGIEFSVGKDSWDGKPCQWIDTFYLSMFLNPDRQGHSVEYFGDILGLEKIDWRKECIDLGMIEKDSPDGQEFKQYHPKMDEYCERDVDVNILIFNYLKKEWKEVYGKEFSITDAFRCGQKSFFLMSCQELTGWKFDIDLANRLVVQISDMMEEIRKEVEPQLPPRELKSTEKLSYKFPAKPFKSSGEFSTSFLKWQEKHNAKIISTDDGILLEAYGKEMKLVPGEAMPITMPMEMSNQDQMKSWFIENGWKPTLWNYKRGPDGKPIRDPKTRDLIKTTPKIQEAGKICPNLMEMEGDLVKLVVKWLSLRNRQSVLQGWLNNPRLQMDGRIGAGRTGIAATHRQKHKVIVNVPKASEKVLLGKEFRSLFICEEGTKIAAGDAAALEGRVQGHYTWRYDNGATAKELLEGDPHSKTAKSVYVEELEHVDINAGDFSKDDPFFKPFRDKSKNIYYAALYGAGDAKIASTAGLPESRGKEISEKFWTANSATKALKDNLEKYWETVGIKKYVPAIDGRILMTRKKSALLNTIFQSCGGIAMDYACCFMDAWLGGLKWKDRKPYYLYKGYEVRRVGYYHDEIEFECEEPIAEEVARMIEKAIAKAGEFLKLNVPLAGEGKVGNNWKETH